MGWNLAERPSFIFLHTCSLLLHIISASLVFYLSPPDNILKPLTVQTYNYTTNLLGTPTIVLGLHTVFERANAFTVIGLNESLTAFSHLIALLMLTVFYNGSDNANKRGYSGRSRPKEYSRRWAEYAVTAGLLEIGILIGQGETSFLLLLVILLANIAMQMIGFYNDQANTSKDGREHWSIIPSVASFIIMGTIIMVFTFHAANASNDSLDSLNYGYLAIVFSIMYMSFGVHQIIYMLDENYGIKWDVDKIYIVLGCTAKIVLSWTYIAVARQTWDELGEPWDDNVPWEGGEHSISTWNTVKVGLLTGAVILILASYIWFGRPSVRDRSKNDETPVTTESGGPLRNIGWKIRSRRGIGSLNF
jgi:hypothetical protein